MKKIDIKLVMACLLRLVLVMAFCCIFHSVNAQQNLLPRFNLCGLPTVKTNLPLKAGNDLILNASGGDYFNWSGPNGFSSNEKLNIITNVGSLNEGIYYVTVTDNYLDTTYYMSTTVTLLANNIVLDIEDTIVCINSNLNLSTLSTYAGYPVTTWLWSGPASFNSNLQSPTITGAQLQNGGQYCVTVTNSNNDSYTECIEIYVYDCCQPRGTTLLDNTTLSHAISRFGDPLPSNITIHGMFIIDKQGYTLSNLNITMLKDAYMGAYSYLDPELSGLNIHACDTLWDIIEFYSQNIVKFNNNHVSGGRNGLQIVHFPNDPTYDFYCSNNYFFDNLYNLSIFEAVNLAYFTLNDFTTTNGLLYPLAGNISNTGLRLQNASISLPDYGSSRVNTFHELRFGISAQENPSLSISKNATKFWNINNTPNTLDGIAIFLSNPPLFSNTGYFTKNGVVNSGGANFDISHCTYGIYSYNFNTNIVDNLMYTVFKGIVITHNHLATTDIENNFIHCQWDGIVLDQNDPSPSISILNNHIYLNPVFGDWCCDHSCIKIAESQNIQPQSNVIGNYLFVNSFAKYGINCNSARNYLFRDNHVRLTDRTFNIAGIHLENNKADSVQCNYVSGPGPLAGDSTDPYLMYPIGIQLIATDDSTNLSCNNVDSTFIGVSFDQSCTPDFIRGTAFINHHGSSRL